MKREYYELQNEGAEGYTPAAPQTPLADWQRAVDARDLARARANTCAEWQFAEAIADLRTAEAAAEAAMKAAGVW